MRNVEDVPEQALSVRNGTHSTPAHNKPPQPGELRPETWTL